MTLLFPKPVRKKKRKTWLIERRKKKRAVKAKEAKGWAEMRKAVVTLDDNRCRSCQVSYALTVHHIKYKSHGVVNKPYNLITLCRACHDLAHGIGVGKLRGHEFVFKLLKRLERTCSDFRWRKALLQYEKRFAQPELVAERV